MTFHEGFELESTDIFQTTNWIVHCVSADMRMSRGFAAQLVKERLTPEEHQRLKRDRYSIGDAVFHDKSHTIHLVTKRFYQDKPRDTQLFERALRNLNAACKVRGIKSLSMPPMQCGLDAKWTHLTVEGLERLLRKYLIHFIFGRTSYLEGNVYYNIMTDIGYFQLLWGYGLS